MERSSGYVGGYCLAVSGSQHWGRLSSSVGCVAIAVARVSLRYIWDDGIWMVVFLGGEVFLYFCSKWEDLIGG